MNKIVFGVGLATAFFGVCLLVYSVAPIVQSSLAHYSSMGQYCNATDPQFHPELASVSWTALFSGIPLCLGLTAIAMGYLMQPQSVLGNSTSCE